MCQNGESMYFFQRLIGAVSRELDGSNRAALPLHVKAPQKDRRGIVLFSTAALMIVLQRFLTDSIASAFPAGRFEQLMLWLAVTIGCFLVIPGIVALMAGFRLRELGVAVEDRRRTLITVAAAGTAAVAIAAAASGSSGFTDLYPFWQPEGRPGDWQRFAVFETVYLLQFAAVEFMFRGVLVHGLKHRLGAWSILFALIPYIMLHFGKPPAEVLASAVGGLLLGYLSLTRGSILAGVALHCIMALSMDMFSLWRQS